MGLVKLSDIAESISFISGQNKIISAYNGKVLCKNYTSSKSEKYKNLSERYVVSIRPKISTNKDGVYSFPYLEISLDGNVEYMEEHNETN